MAQRIGLFSICTLFMLIFHLLSPQPVVYASGTEERPLLVVCASSITVTSSANSGAGSLRQAIENLCAGGTITFAEALSGQTISPETTLALVRNITIDASSLPARLVLSGSNALRVLEINTGVSATLNSLAIANGYCDNCDGGGVHNQGILLVKNSLMTNNHADNGGAIQNTGGSVAVIDTTFSSNESGVNGGAINNDGPLTITNSTFINNAGGYGGAIHDEPFSQEVYPVVVANSSFYGNTAWYGGGIDLYDGSIVHPFSVINSTFANNSSAISNRSGSVKASNTIVANSGNANCSGLFAPGSSTNLSSDNSCSGYFTYSPSILLAEPANNGGPTQTMALLAGSAAIDAGDDATCAADPVSKQDQRRMLRPLGAHCDIGAYEYSQYNLAVTGAASQRSFFGAALNGVVNAANFEAIVTFEYGLTSAYGMTVPASQSPVTGSSDTAVSAVLAGLPHNTTYHYRVVAAFNTVKFYGSDRTFTTLIPLYLPAVTK